MIPTVLEHCSGQPGNSLWRTERIPLVRTVVWPPCNDGHTDPGTDMAAPQSMRRHLVRYGEAIQAGFFHRVHLDGKSRVAACCGPQRHGQSVEPLHQARDRPIAVPRCLGVIRAIHWAYAACASARAVVRLERHRVAQPASPASAKNATRQDRNLSFRTRDMTEMSVAPWRARDVALSLEQKPHRKVRNLPARSKQTGTLSRGTRGASTTSTGTSTDRHADCFVAGPRAREPARDWPTFVRLLG
jgi:hypothetical protein